jgi:hypothetical protein
VVAEASLLGSGRIVEIHGLTLKMWLFIAAQFYVMWQVLVPCKRLSLATMTVVTSFLVLLCTGILAGLATGAAGDAILEDVKPLIYVLSIAFYELTIRSEWHLHLALSIMKVTSFLMACAYLVVVGLLLAGILPFSLLYGILSNIGVDDFMFRGDTGAFFYKGAIYIAVGMILFAFEKGWKAITALCVGIGGLLATGTRGFFLALGIVLLVHTVLSARGLMSKIRYAAALATLACLTWFWFASSTLDRSGSDQVRGITFIQVLDRTTPVTFLLGHGFGNGVPERPIHMEITYLEIFYKQGLFGIAWWVALLGLICARYRQARRTGYARAEPLLLCALFVGMVSLTNPFINNPIGMSIWLVSFIGLSPQMHTRPAREEQKALAA